MQQFSDRLLNSFGALVIGVVALAMPASTSAQGIKGGEAGSLFPVEEETTVRLESQKAQFVPESDEQDRWRVEVKYDFQNDDDEPKEIEVAFLETTCVDVPTDCNSPQFDDLSVEVDGESKELRREDVTEDHWASRHGRAGQNVYRFDVRFPAEESVSIRHKLSHGASSGGPAGSLGLDPGLGFDFVPGADWNGPIEDVRAEITFFDRPWAFRFSPSAARSDDGDGLELIEYVETVDSGKADTSFVFRAKKWTPTDNFGIRFYTNTTFKMFGAPGGPFEGHPISKCPPPIAGLWYRHVSSEDFELDHARDIAEHYLREYPNDPEGFIATLADEKSAETLRRCRNAVFAKHGYSFNSDDLDAFFYGDEVDQPEHYARSQLVTFRENPHFSRRLLSPVERFYVKLIKAAEDRQDSE